MLTYEGSRGRADTGAADCASGGWSASLLLVGSAGLGCGSRCFAACGDQRLVGAVDEVCQGFVGLGVG